MDLAVRWVLDQPGITAALWGARHPAELEAVAGAVDWNLDADTRAAVDQILRETIANPIGPEFMAPPARNRDRKSTRLNSSHVATSYAVFCMKKKNVLDQQIA